MFAEGSETRCMVQSTNCFSHKSKELLGQVVPDRLVVLTLGWRTARVPGHVVCRGRADRAASWGWPSERHLVSGFVLSEGPHGSFAPVGCCFGSSQSHCC